MASGLQVLFGEFAKLMRERRVGMSAIGQCLKEQYDALATPIPPHLAALVRQLETQK
jgi:hypothetical protein